MSKAVFLDRDGEELDHKALATERNLICSKDRESLLGSPQSVLPRSTSVFFRLSESYLADDKQRNYVRSPDFGTSLFSLISKLNSAAESLSR